ncbi:MAG TPA: autotransporter-associated beta strand repeat-containing protein [Rhizomicrobium sp.]|nr:autotransporter-associated beta strand repeat-containing protein [Rhizomicrobium sp.]
MSVHFAGRIVLPTTHKTIFSRLTGVALFVLAGLLHSAPATAACLTSGITTNCTTNTPNPYTGTIGNGQSTASGYSVTLQPGAQISSGNANAISLGDNAVINLGTGSLVTNAATSGSGTNGNGLWNAGKNTIEFGSNGQLTIGTGATVQSTGTSNNAEAINVMGIGNTITNYGTITSRSGAAIWFEDRTTGGSNTVDNYGTITTSLGANSNVIGNNSNGNVNFINESGAVVNGSLSFAAGNDTLTLFPNSTITGGFNGGGGTNTLILNGAAGSSDTLAGNISNFQTLTKTGQGTWTLSGAVGNNGGNGALNVEVQAGTLALTGNNSNFNGSVLVDAAGTLEARAQSLPPTVTDNGLVRFAQDTAGTYAGVISGTGAVEKTLGGTLTLTGASTYSGGTTVNLGEVVVSSDANLGAVAGSLILDGGALGTTADTTLTRTVTLGASGGTIDPMAGTLTLNGAVVGGGTLTKTGAGILNLAAANSYIGNTIINQGTVQIASDANLGNPASNLEFNGGTLATTADVTTARSATLGAAGGTLQTAAGTTLTDSGVISGTGMLTKTGDGTLALTAINTQLGGTSINGGKMIVTNDAQLGDPSAPLQFDGGTLVAGAGTAVRPTVIHDGGGTAELDGDPQDQSQWLTITGVVSGTGSLTKTGSGTIIYSGDNSYTGPTTIAGGYLYINGNSAAQTGIVTAQSGTRLGGTGTIGGSVVIQDGATLSPGSVPGTPATLTINGDLTLANNSTLFYNLVEADTAGGALNDLTVVHGNLTLGGTIDIADQGQTLGPGIYRIFNYDGTLTNNGLTLGTLTTDPSVTGTPLTGFFVQTSIPGQVNLVNPAGQVLNYWDSPLGNGDGIITGGDGPWSAAPPPTGNDNWTDATGIPAAPWSQDGFAIFAGAPGTVTVDDTQGAVRVEGMQFAVDGYTINGDPLTLVNNSASPAATEIRVGDGSSASAAMTATISAVLAGNAAVKTGPGTLVLTGNNSFGDPGSGISLEIFGGTVQVSSDANLGAAGDLVAIANGATLRTTDTFTIDRRIGIGTPGGDVDGGTIETAAGTVLTVNGAIIGNPTDAALTKTGDGTLVLLSSGSSYTGGTTISAGTLQLGNGGTTGAIVGNVTDNAAIVFNRADPVVFDGAITGSGTLTEEGGGTLTLTADNSYTGGTTIVAGSTLQLGNGGATGSITGDVTDNGALIFNRGGSVTYTGVISGPGTVTQAGPGITILMGNNSYTGPTTVSNGWLYVDGDQSAATGAMTVAGGARLSGNGIVGGNVTMADNATLSPGAVPQTPATLTINGNLTLSNNTQMLYNLAQANVAGGALNDLTVVKGNLTLDGVINVADEGQALGPGVYRIFNYSGTLTDNGLAVGSYETTPADPSQTATPTRPLTDFVVQTAIPGQVNLVNTNGLALTYWDGGDLVPALKDNTVVDGGNGTWQAPGPASTDNWTNVTGATNAPWDNSGVIAIFSGIGAGPNPLLRPAPTPLCYGTQGRAGCTVTVDDSQGQVTAGGIQFATSGYKVVGGALNLVDIGGSGITVIRVGDGSDLSSGIVAEIDSVLLGSTTLTKIDQGTLILAGANTYSGGTEIDGGTIQISSDANLGAPGTGLVLDGGALASTADVTSARAVTLNAGGGTFLPAAATALELDAAIAGPGSLTMGGAGTLVLTAEETYSGGTIISGGVLQVGNGGRTGSISGNVADGGTLVFNRSDTVTYAGTISDYSYTDINGNPATSAGNLVQNGSGTLILTGDSSFTGTTTIASGTLQLGNGGASGVVVGDIVDNGTLVVNRSDTVTINGLISGTGDFVQAGTGTTILTGNGQVNTYSGTTYIDQGTLQLGTGGASGGLVSRRLINNGVEIIDLGIDFSTDAVATGTGSVIVKLGENNTMVVLGNNSYTGGSTLLSGTVQFGDGGTNGLIVGTINNFGTIIFNHSDDLIYDGLITGTGNAIKLAPDRLTWASDNTYTGGTLISEGTLQLGIGGTTGSILGDVVDNAELAFNRSDSLLMNGVISGTGKLTQMGTGTTVLGADNSYTGGTTISAGTLQVGNGDIHGSIVGDVTDNGILSFSRSDIYTFAGTVSGSGQLVQAGSGTLILTAANSYSGGTSVEDGVLQIASDDNLGAASGPLHIGGATLSVTADITSARPTILEQGGGTFLVPAGITLQENGTFEGAGGLTLTGGGLMILTGDGTYNGGTSIQGSTLQIGNGGATGSITGDVIDDGLLVFDRSNTLTIGGIISGTGSLTQDGAGTTILTGNNAYAGPTLVSAGTLFVNGDQSAATGLTTVASGATLGGTGIIGGDVVIPDGATLAPGDDPGTLTINGSLSLSSGSLLAYDLGRSNVIGGPLNDHTIVKGDLILDGTLNVITAPGGSFDPGVYRIITYASTFTNNGLEIGTIPSPNFYVQTSVANAVNLVNTNGLTLNFWDGAAGPRNDGMIQGGNGTWQSSAGNDNWTDINGTVNAPFTDAAFAIFQGAGGTVTVDGSLGAVRVEGAQFAADGYVIQGDAITLAGGATTLIRVGDGTAESAAFTTTMDSVLTGNTTLVKDDLGTLILGAANTYTGGTVIEGGVLQISSDANLGLASGALTLDGGTLASSTNLTLTRATSLDGIGGGFAPAGGTALTMDTAISGTGMLYMIGDGTLILTKANSYSGGTTISTGILQLGNGGTTGSIMGDVVDNATLAFDRSDTVTFSGVISGTGGVTQAGSGTTILDTGETYSGSTTVNAGTLAVGDADHTAAILSGGGLVTVASGATFGGYGATVGDVTNNGTIAVADAIPAFAGQGTGSFTVAGTLTNTGLVALGGAGVGNQLNVSFYAGQDGRIALNSMLDGDGSPSDLLAINGGTATGHSTITVTNVGGMGAATPGNGILLVSALNGATTASDAFSLAGRAVAGPYQYTLFRGARDGSAPDSWYLRTEATNPPGGGEGSGEGNGGGTTNPPGGGGTAPPTGPVTPNYRAEVSLYAALPSMALGYGTTLIGTLHKRVGEEAFLAGEDGQEIGFSGAWTRLIADDSRWSAAPGGIYSDGPSFNSGTLAVQGGVDLYHSRTGENREFAGLLASFGHVHGAVTHYDGTFAGNDRFGAISVGGYWTHFGPGGWYVDGVMQGTWYNARANSAYDTTLKTTGGGVNLSAEGGYPFVLGDTLLGEGWTLEPQVQLIYQHLTFSDGADIAAQVHFDQVSSLAGRIGGRATHSWTMGNGRPLTGWLLANVWNEFQANPKTEFSSDAGFVPFQSDLTGPWGEVGLGLNAQITETLSLYASASYQKGFDRGIRSFSGSIGVRINP